MTTTLPAIPTTLPISASKGSPSAWNGWSPSLGITGRLPIGIGGRLRPEYAVSGFAKKKEKTPRQEIDVASARRQDYLSRRPAQ